VLDWDEAPEHPHNVARGTFANVGGVVQPAPAPRFSRTAPVVPPAAARDDGPTVLRRWGVAAEAIAPPGAS
jgi:alpha-methylacyl-CoA racemase